MDIFHGADSSKISYYMVQIKSGETAFLRFRGLLKKGMFCFRSGSNDTSELLIRDYDLGVIVVVH